MAVRSFLIAVRIAVVCATLRAVRRTRWRFAFSDDLIFATSCPSRIETVRARIMLTAPRVVKERVQKRRERRLWHPPLSSPDGDGGPRPDLARSTEPQSLQRRVVEAEEMPGLVQQGGPDLL